MYEKRFPFVCIGESVYIYSNSRVMMRFPWQNAILISPRFLYWSRSASAIFFPPSFCMHHHSLQNQREFFFVPFQPNCIHNLIEFSYRVVLCFCIPFFLLCAKQNWKPSGIRHGGGGIYQQFFFLFLFRMVLFGFYSFVVAFVIFTTLKTEFPAMKFQLKCINVAKLPRERQREEEKERYRKKCQQIFYVYSSICGALVLNRMANSVRRHGRT